MRIYLVSRKTLIKALFIILIGSVILVSLPYKDKIYSVFNTNKDIPIYSVDTETKKIALTFDCAWGADDIEDIISILNKYNVKSTFFMVGTWMDKFSNKVKLLSEAGHEIANHSDTHLDMTKLDNDKIISEIKNANNKIEKITGRKNNLFRAPYGAYNSNLVRVAKSIGQYVIQWDVDSLDWKDLGVESMRKRINKKIKKGSILLFHNDTKYTVQGLPTIIEDLQKQGYKFVTVSELILKNNYYIDHKGTQHNLIKESSSVD